MNDIDKKTAEQNVDGEQWCDQVNQLADQVKMLALNLAINLAKSKNEIEDLTVLEPEFTKLVNGSVEIVKEVTMILKAFKNEEKLVYSANDSGRNFERIEMSLNEILTLSKNVQESISEIKKRNEQMDKI